MREPRDTMIWQTTSMVDPGFPVGVVPPRQGAPTPDTPTFRKICMSKRKNRGPLGGGTPGAPPGSSTELG